MNPTPSDARRSDTELSGKLGTKRNFLASLIEGRRLRRPFFPVRCSYYRSESSFLDTIDRCYVQERTGETYFEIPKIEEIF